MNINQLNAQLQRLPTNWLVKMGKDLGLTISASEVTEIKQRLQYLATISAPPEEVANMLAEVLGQKRTELLLNVLQNKFF